MNSLIPSLYMYIDDFIVCQLLFHQVKVFLTSCSIFNCHYLLCVISLTLIHLESQTWKFSWWIVLPQARWNTPLNAILSETVLSNKQCCYSTTRGRVCNLTAENYKDRQSRESQMVWKHWFHVRQPRNAFNQEKVKWFGNTGSTFDNQEMLFCQTKVRLGNWQIARAQEVLARSPWKSVKWLSRQLDLTAAHFWHYLKRLQVNPYNNPLVASTNGCWERQMNCCLWFLSSLFKGQTSRCESRTSLWWTIY